MGARGARTGRAVALAVTILWLGAVAARAAPTPTPSQVLVLYNADWTGDHPLTAPGQDSREVAEQYARLRTDPATGEGPRVLGLRCVHRAGHLNQDHLAEASRDNPSGVVLRRGGRVVGSAGEFRDSRAVELVLPERGAGCRPGSLAVRLRPASGPPLEVVVGGASRFPDLVVTQPAGDWNVRLDGRSLLTGPLVAEASCEGLDGEAREWRAEYQDVLDVACSRTGPDGVRDDLHYLEDVEAPVRRFLEDPANARPDGTLLKDHVLFVVVCYGLPRTAAATYGIARGVNDRLGDHGPWVDLGQRLQLLHYDLEGLSGFVPRPHRFLGDHPFTAFLFRAPQAWPLIGPGANPFLHPEAYREKGDLGQLPEPRPFTPAERRREPARHLYFAMRLDGRDALEALALADRAAYASVFGAPRGAAGPAPPGGADRSAEGFLRHLGFRDLGVERAARTNLKFLSRAPEGEGRAGASVFLPGGVAGQILSSNGWSNPRAGLYGHLSEGVTISAGAARVMGGAGHIHDRSWWDDGVLYPFLVRGRTAGECLLMNQLHLEWVTSFVGDPLYRLPESPAPAPAPPVFDWAGDVRWVAGPGDPAGPWIRVALPQSPGRRRVAQGRLFRPGQAASAVSSGFGGTVAFSLAGVEAAESGEWCIELTDPAGGRHRGCGAVAGGGR
ncbi:MAG: hypothetical protein ACYDA8_19520 [Deferrisomatales bacterium]